MADDLAALREELAALRARVEAMEKFVSIEKDEVTGKPVCTLYAAELFLREEGRPNGASMDLFFKKGAPHLALVNDKGKSVFDAYETTSGKAVVRVFGDDDSARVNLTTDDRGFGTIAVFGAGKAALATMRANEEGGIVGIMAPKGKAAAGLSFVQGPGLKVFSPSGALTVVLGVQEESGGLMINHPEGRQLVGLGTCQGGSILTLDNAAGQRGFTIFAKTEKTEFWQVRPGTEKDGVAISADAKGSGLYLLRSGHTVAQLGDITQGFVMESKIPGHEMKLESPEIIVGAGLSLRSTTGLNLELRSTPVGEQICIKNKDSAPMLKLGATAGGGHLALFDELGLEVAELGGMEHGGGLTLAGPTGPQVLAVSGPEGGVVLVRDAEGHTAASLPPDADVQTEDDGEP